MYIIFITKTSKCQISSVLPIIHLAGQIKKTLKSFFSVSHSNKLRSFALVGQNSNVFLPQRGSRGLMVRESDL